MEDPLKVFLGQLHGGITKPTLMDRLTAMGLPWIDIIVPRGNTTLAVAFVIFGTPADGAQCFEAMHGLADPLLSATCVQAATRPTWEPSVCL